MAMTGTGPNPNATEELLEVLKKLSDKDLEKLALAHDVALIDGIRAECRRRRNRQRPLRTNLAGRIIG